MPKVHEMIESKYLKKEDVANGALVTVAGLERVNIAMEKQKPDFKWIMSFHEIEKPMVMNSTNIQLCEIACGSDDTDDWIGKKIVLYSEPNISFQGKLVGGIRLRAPRKQTLVEKTESIQKRVVTAMERSEVPEQSPYGERGDLQEMEDDIPF